MLDMSTHSMPTQFKPRRLSVRRGLGLATGLVLSGTALAAGETPSFFTELAALMVASAVIAFIGFRIGLTPIVGFLLAGVVIGPNALGLVQDRALIDAAAEVGVILLLFTIGIEFSLETLARIGRLIFGAGGLMVGGIVLLTTLALAAFGAPWQTGVFTGFLLSLSSTAIVMKLLADRSETTTEPGQASLGILIFQDLAVVAMVLVVPMLGGQGGGALSLAWALLKAVGIIAIVLFGARRLMPKLLEAVARTCSPEIFLLTVIAVCFGTAYLTGLVGVSLSLGAFLAGLLVGESRFSQQAFSEILPLQILFSAAFFLSVGMLLDLQFLFANLPLVLLGVVMVVVLKTLVTALGVRLLGYGLGVSLATGLMLAQVGEFSFVLERAGREVGLTPLGLGADGAQTFIACTVLLMGITPSLASLGSRVARRLEHRAPPPTAGEENLEDLAETFAALNDHVVIAGYGETGQALATALDAAAVPYAIATLSPTGASQAEEKGRKVVRGDYTKGYILELVGLQRASLLVIPDDEPAMAHRTVSVAKATRPDLDIVVYSPYSAAAQELRESCATTVVSADHAATKLVVGEVLSRAGVGGERRAKVLETFSANLVPGHAPNLVTLSEAQRTSEQCSHTNNLSTVRAPAKLVCPACVALGDTWVHLRICMTCGAFGCCDSSKNKHATAHYQESEHSVIKSLEKGESWAWCYVDKVSL
ncbi:cation:proton antiporter [soil metagenome]